MKRKSLLAGIMTLAMLGGCVLAVDASESKREASAASRRQTVRLLEEKLGYLRAMGGKLQKNVAAGERLNESGQLSLAELGALQVRLLDVRARRVDVQLELAQWRRTKKSKRGK